MSYISGGTRLAINLVETSLEWSSSDVDISGITNYSSPETDFSGKANTAAWVSYYGSSVTNYAPGYCYNYTTAGTSKGQWYLPAAGELYASINTSHNRSAVNNGIKAAGGTQLSGYYWSSSEYISSHAWEVGTAYGNVYGRSKNLTNYVRCVLAF